MEAIGKQIILELEKCSVPKLKNQAFVSQTMNLAAEKMGATVVISEFHRFSPYGISGVVVIQESHLTIHTWPEYQYAAIDIFTCGTIDLQKGTDFLIETFEARESDYRLLFRGKIPPKP